MIMMRKLFNLPCALCATLYLTSVRRKKRKEIQPRKHTKQHEKKLLLRVVSCVFVVKFFLIVIMTADIEVKVFLASPVAAQKRAARPAAKKPAAAVRSKSGGAPQTKAQPSPQPSPQPTPQLKPTPPPAPAAEPFDKATVEQMAAQCVKLETEAGTIEMKLLPETAPETVRNFLNLAATGAFDTTTFSRVVKDFVIQGGNLSTRETMTPALALRSRRTIPDEPNAVKHTRGIVSMARPDEPNSATTNFFILVKDATYLDGTFAAFARVTKGMEVADAINQAPVEGEKPAAPVRMRRAVVSPCAVAPVNESQ
jgi:peptidyl-prolyl cis-trans isomerase B (cyclophilin B)